MCVINMRVHCSDMFSELLLDDKEQTELTIECVVSTALLEIFDNVQVETVTLQSSSDEPRTRGSVLWD